MIYSQSCCRGLSRVRVNPLWGSTISSVIWVANVPILIFSPTNIAKLATTISACHVRASWDPLNNRPTLTSLSVSTFHDHLGSIVVAGPLMLGRHAPQTVFRLAKNTNSRSLISDYISLAVFFGTVPLVVASVDFLANQNFIVFLFFV